MMNYKQAKFVYECAEETYITQLLVANLNFSKELISTLIFTPSKSDSVLDLTLSQTNQVQSKKAPVTVSNLEVKVM